MDCRQAGHYCPSCPLSEINSEIRAVSEHKLVGKPVYAFPTDTLVHGGIDLYRVSEPDKTEWNNPECVFVDPKSILPALLGFRKCDSSSGRLSPV